MVKIGDVNLGEFPLLLAPMEDISDPPFRAVCKANGVDMMYTEFISSDALIRDADKSVQKLDIYDYERPIGIQIFGDKVDAMREAAAIADACNPEVVDINYGCPVKKVACKGAGAGLLQDLVKMQNITAEIVKRCTRPVTVKTRLGWDDDTKNILEAAQRLQDVGVQALTIHGRTRAQMYKGEADWTLISEVKNLPGIRMPIFGNGDIDSPQKALEYKNKFREVKHYFATGEILAPPTIKERIDTCKQHLKFSVEWKGERVGIFEMRNHYTSYFKGIADFKPFRLKLVEAGTYQETLNMLDEIVHTFG